MKKETLVKTCINELGMDIRYRWYTGSKIVIEEIDGKRFRAIWDDQKVAINFLKDVYERKINGGENNDNK